MTENGPRERREAFYVEAADFTTHLTVVDRNGATFLVPTWDTEVGRKLFVHGARQEMKALASVVRVLRRLGMREAVVGRTFVDVGANIGTSAITAIRSHGFGRALAVEPEPRNVRVLRANVVLNDLEDRVRVIEAAVTDRPGRGQLALHLSNAGAHQLVAGEGPLHEGPHAPLGVRIDVPAVSLDSLVESGELTTDDVGLLWLDVQGHEGHVLRGARRLTRRGTPLVVEVYPVALERSGGLELLLEEATRDYTHFVDIRALRTDASPEASLRSSADLTALADELGTTLQGRHTDVLLVRLPPEGRGRDITGARDREELGG